MAVSFDIRRWFRYLVILILTSPPALPQELRGTVIQKDDKLPLPSVNVLLKDTKFGAMTDSLGQFEVKNFPPGVYVVQGSRVGYKTNWYILTASQDEQTTLLIELEQEPIQLGEVLVSDSARMKSLSALGKTIVSSEEIKRSGTKSLATFLRSRYPGLFPTYTSPGIVRRTYQNLHFVLYLNGTLVQYTSDVLDTMIDVDNVDYIEVYRSFGMTPTRDRGSYERVIHIHTKIPELRR